MLRYFFFPDYRAYNPYLALLHAALPAEWAIESGDIGAAIKSCRSSPHGTVIFHLHWTAPVLARATDRRDAKRREHAFMVDARRFVDLGGRLAWTVHNTLPHECAYPDVERSLRQQLADVAHVVHVHWQSAVEQVADHYTLARSRLAVVPFGHFVDEYPNIVDRDQARRILRLSDEVVFLFLGQLRPYKGVERLLTAFTEADTGASEARLIIAGRPVHPTRPGEISRASSSLRGVDVVEDHIPDEELQVYFNACDYVVLPYERVLTSASAIAAMGFGCPVIGPELGMLPDVIEDGHNGFLYRPGSTAALSAAIARAARVEPQTRARLGAAARDTVAALDWRDTGRRLRLALLTR